jgi:hypothetical protein
MLDGGRSTAAGAKCGVPPDLAGAPMKATAIVAGIGVLAAVLLSLVLGMGGQPSPSGAPTASAAPSASSSSSSAPTSSPAGSPTPSPVSTPAPPSTSVPTARPAPTPVPTPRPARIRSFTGPESVDCADSEFSGFIRLRWEVVRATGVTISIDGPGIYDRYDDTAGSAVVPFACGDETHTYLLTTVGGVGTPDTAKLVIGVSAG